jgi:Protein of unknown function (DUF2950)
MRTIVMPVVHRAVAASALLFALAVVAPASAQQAYPSPEAAGQALIDAIATSDGAALTKVLGADWRRFIPTVDVDQDDVYAFLAASAKSTRIVRENADHAHLAVGAQDWKLPIPIVQKGGAWRFDVHAGADEMRTRRIGRNELAAMQSALAYYDAQREYATRDRDGNGVLEYAQRIASTQGRRDGLYWGSRAGEPESPLGPAYGDAKPGESYHGYFFRILKAQGPNARGGARDYVIKGRMTGGFALVAWPAKYGETGVMTFIINHDGQIFEKNLGPGGDAVARAMTRFDPDASWQKVTP